MDSFGHYSKSNGGNSGVFMRLDTIERRLDHQDQCVDDLKKTVGEIRPVLMATKFFVQALGTLGAAAGIITAILEWVHHR